MRKKLIFGINVLLMSVLCACGKNANNPVELETAQQTEIEVVTESETVAEETAHFSENELVTEETDDYNETSSVSNEEELSVETSETPEVSSITSVVVENPSWNYYIAKESETETVPYELILLEEKTNQIVDVDNWFAENGLDWLSEVNNEKYHCVVEGDSLVNIYKDGQLVTVLDFINYMYPDEYVLEDAEFVEEYVGSAVINGNILYVSTFHYTYASSAPSNAYITAISLEDFSVIWKSQPLVCNANNFEVVENVIFCGYGFTAEADYLYQLDKKTGMVLGKTELKSKPDYIIFKDGNLYVRTYNTDYVFEVK